MTISRSPARGSFSVKHTKEKLEKDPTNENALAMLDYQNSFRRQVLEQEEDPEWQKDNLEYDLRTTDWILEKVRASSVYAQNLYAAMCNNEFQKRDVMPVLKDKRWSCSWRYAGGIIADMREEGDYIDWYCSGIREKDAPDNGYVAESVVTDEIRADLDALGWKVLENNDDTI